MSQPGYCGPLDTVTVIAADFHSDLDYGDHHRRKTPKLERSHIRGAVPKQVRGANA